VIKSWKALALRRFRDAGVLTASTPFTFDSSQHLSPRSKLLPDSHVVRSAQDVAGMGRKRLRG
jgi:hypothetical protein